MISVEGLVMPNKPLTNLEIIDAVRKLEIRRFRGVFLRDNLTVEPKRMECGVLNLQPPTELKRYLKSPIFYNTEQIQPKQEVFC